MKTGNAPLRNGDFRRVAYRRKTAQALRQQASGRFLVAAFREQARRFGTERPRPQMLVVAFDRPLDFLIEIKPPDGRQPSLLVSRQHVEHPRIGIDGAAETIPQRDVHRPLHRRVRRFDVPLRVMVEREPAHTPYGDFGFRFGIDHAEHVVDELQRLLMPPHVQEHHRQLPFPPQDLETVLAELRCPFGRLEDAYRLMETPQIHGGRTRVQREHFRLEPAFPQLRVLQGHLKRGEGFPEMTVPEVEHAHKILRLPPGPGLVQLKQRRLALGVQLMHTLRRAFRRHVFKAGLHQMQQGRHAGVPLLLGCLKGSGGDLPCLTMAFGEIHGNVASRERQLHEGLFLTGGGTRRAPSAQQPQDKAIAGDGPARLGTVQQRVDESQQKGTGFEVLPFVKGGGHISDLGAHLPPCVPHLQFRNAPGRYHDPGGAIRVGLELAALLQIRDDRLKLLQGNFQDLGTGLRAEAAGDQRKHFHDEQGEGREVHCSLL